MAAASVPSVGVEESSAQPSAVPPFRAAGLATIDAVDTTVGAVKLRLHRARIELRSRLATSAASL